MNRAKIGLIAGLLGTIGIPLGLGVRYVRDFVKSYSAALSNYRAAELMPYDVPPDGSVGIDDIAKGEGLSTYTEKSAFRTVAGENLFGKDARDQAAIDNLMIE